MQENNTAVFTLRIIGTTPETLPLERFAEYVRLFAKLLGEDNHPVFKQLIDGSAQLKSDIPFANEQTTHERLNRAANDSTFEPHKHIRLLEKTLQKDGFECAEIINSYRQAIIFVVKPFIDEVSHTVWQTGDVDGEVTGVKGEDDTMHIHIKSLDGEKLSLSCDVALARNIAQEHLRHGTVRLHVQGKWSRTPFGWKPDNKAKVTGFETLNEMPLLQLFQSLRTIPDNGWSVAANPAALTQELRGKTASDFYE